MGKISSVTITDFWGDINFSLPLNKDINIIVGSNGSGKTYLLNIITSTLLVDGKSLQNLIFKSVEIKIKLPGTRKLAVIKLEKLEDSAARRTRPARRLRYNVDGKVYEFNSDISDAEAYTRLLRKEEAEVYEKLRQDIAGLVRLDFLPVGRNLRSYKETLERDIQSENTGIDSKILSLQQQFTNYQLKISSQLEDISKGLEKEILLSLLYDSNIDIIDPGKINEEYLVDSRIALQTAYESLGILDKESQKLIDRHVKEVTSKLRELKVAVDQGLPIRLDMLAPIPLLKRTQKIVNLSLLAESKKQEVVRRRQLLLDTLKGMFNDKDVHIFDEKNIIFIKYSKSGKPIFITPMNLSSGEKNLYIILLECLLQEDLETTFVVDEPEISLHIEWQQQLIGAIRALNSKAQLIVATHSPEIVAQGIENIIDLEGITYGDTSLV